nr:hypothetical protein [Thiolapillus sp.]
MFSLWRKARRENSAASRLLGTTSLRFALHGWQRMIIGFGESRASKALVPFLSRAGQQSAGGAIEYGHGAPTVDVSNVGAFKGGANGEVGIAILVEVAAGQCTAEKIIRLWVEANIAKIGLGDDLSMGAADYRHGAIENDHHSS